MKHRIAPRRFAAAISMACLAGTGAAKGDAIFSPGDDIRGIQVDGDAINVGAGGVAPGANNWPAFEGPEHAIDGVGQKYLNFGITNTGFLTTPSAGSSNATSLTVWTANDAEPRDPSSYEIWGTNDAITGDGPFSLSAFTLISAGDIALPSSRNVGGDAPLLRENSATINFVNAEFFTSYLIVFPDVKDKTAANSMQIGEAQLDGVICDDSVDADGDGIGDLCDACDGDDAAGDSDGDGLCDDLDGCPHDPDKDDPGICGCGVPDTDGDGDAVADCDDPCPSDNPDDTDGDGVCDSADPCPSDNPDDSDGDGVCDSADPCPTENPDDSDGDGICDSADRCPNADDALDADGNGTPDCLEPPPAPQNEPVGCCAPGTFPMVGLFTPLILIGWKRRRRRPGEPRDDSRP